MVIGSVRRTLLLLAVGVAVAAGCGGSGYTYHSNRDEKLYFKVPDDWTVYDHGDFPDGGPGGGMWVRGFVAGAAPTLESAFRMELDQPRGYVQIEPLDVAERDTLSVATLRGTNLGTDENGLPLDPIAYADAHPEEVQVLDYDDPIVVDEGPHGIHIRVAFAIDGGDVAVVDQTVLVDAATTRRYVLSIGCLATCFDEHEGEIEEVIESWTLEAR